MGLEIQDDELDQSVFNGSQITSGYHTGRADQLRWVKENFVDLGLPSGNLWCKWNIGATNGDTPESWYGNYYAWGEVEPKTEYTWKNQKHCGGPNETLTKYNDKDGKLTLDPEDDVVSVTLGKEFKMPTKEDFEELCSLPSEWVKKYNGVRGLNGRIFTGNNGNELFIPAAGCYAAFGLSRTGLDCNLWSSSCNTDNHFGAFVLFFSSHEANLIMDGRHFGQSVRGVLKTR